jgi:Arc/MetJ-type ribon-helix-helix transcriptional regulator
MKRTTISLPDSVSSLLEREARRRETSASEVVRRALAAYFQVEGVEPRDLPFANLGASGHANTARDHEQILRSAWGRARRS